MFDLYMQYEKEDEPYITFDRGEFLTFLQRTEESLGRTFGYVFSSLPKEVRL